MVSKIHFRKFQVAFFSSVCYQVVTVSLVVVADLIQPVGMHSPLIILLLPQMPGLFLIEILPFSSHIEKLSSFFTLLIASLLQVIILTSLFFFAFTIRYRGTKFNRDRLGRWIYKDNF